MSDVIVKKSRISVRKVFAFKSHYQKVKEFYAKYERWLMPVTLAFGFLADYCYCPDYQHSL